MTEQEQWIVNALVGISLIAGGILTNKPLSDEAVLEILEELRNHVPQDLIPMAQLAIMAEVEKHR